MIDLHVHLLPAVDDGPSSLEVSAAMIERARGFGFTTLVATPHLSGVLAPDYDAHVRSALVAVRAIAVEAGLDVRLGFEIMLSPALPNRLGRGESSTLGGSRSVLVELPFAGWPLHVEQSLFDLQSAGFRPVLAHPERYVAVQRTPAKALDLVERGIFLQVTFGSLAGLFGKPAQSIAELLLRENAATVLASDAHSAGKRFAAVEDGLRRAELLVGGERLRQLVVDAPAALLADAPLPIPVAPHSAPGSNGWRASIKRATARLRG